MKTESKQLRDTIWVLWNKKELDIDSELYYKKVMAMLRGIVLKKIEFDNKFMEDQILLAQDYS